MLTGACSSSTPATSPNVDGAGGASESSTTTAVGDTSSTGGAKHVGGSSSRTTGQSSGGDSASSTGRADATGGRTVTTSTEGRQSSGGSSATRASTPLGGSTSLGSGGSKASGGSANPGTGGSSLGVIGGSSSGGGSSSSAATSAGCGKQRTLQNGTLTITVNKAARKYILRVPDGYDSEHPYRLVLAYAWSGGSASQVASSNYFTFATEDSKNTIFAAPEASDGAGSWSKDDVAFTDAILSQIEGDLCIDPTRVFATGFSFGGGMAMALACTRADVFRAVAFFSGADLTGSCPTTLTKPIAYYASQASEDANGMSPTNPMTGEMKQAQFAAVNGCTAEPSSTTFPAAGQPHVCTIYKNCSAGHPTEYCVFNGAHGWEPKDPGQSTSWNATEAWKFITQF